MADYLIRTEPELKGFSDKNLWRMKQFYEAYKDNPKLSALLRETHPNIMSTFRDDYVFEFLGLPESHGEGDLQKGLIGKMKHFILELGKDFIFIGEEYRVQVGNSDFYIDLLFYHRGLQCLVAFELKTDKFKPEHLGQLNFYLEALDRDVKKPNENPSIGVLLCKDKDSEVVEYALSRAAASILDAYFPDEQKTDVAVDVPAKQQEPEELSKSGRTIAPDEIFRTRMYDKFREIEARLIRDKYLDENLNWMPRHKNDKPDIKKLVTLLAALIDNNYFLPNRDAGIKAFFEARYRLSIGQNFERKRREPLLGEYKAAFYNYPF